MRVMIGRCIEHVAERLAVSLRHLMLNNFTTNVERRTQGRKELMKLESILDRIITMYHRLFHHLELS